MAKVSIEGLKAEVESYSSAIKGYNDDLFKDKSKEEKTSISSKIAEYKTDIEQLLSHEVEDIKNYFVEIYGDKDKEGKKAGILKLEEELKELKDRSDSLLASLTDKSLHDAFTRRANDYTDEYKKIRKWYSAILIILAGVYLYLLFDGMHDKDINFRNTIYQLALATPLGFLVWMLNREQKIAKKLAEEYHHKASISAASRFLVLRLGDGVMSRTLAFKSIVLSLCSFELPVTNSKVLVAIR